MSYLNSGNSPYQSAFLRFHEEIKLKNTKDNKELREKRDILLNRLRAAGIRFDYFNQGSYAMGTGVKPLQGQDYDIDVGLILKGDVPEDPVDAKIPIFEALDGHTKDVQFRRPCITVFYAGGFHVDLAIYRKTIWGDLQLASGKRHSSLAQRAWAQSEPKRLKEVVAEIGTSSGGKEQFRRVIRYLKRWRDLHFPTDGNSAPVGIGLTVAGHRYFRPVGSGTQSGFDDLEALRGFVGSLVAARGRIRANLPVAPFDDVFASMTDDQMMQFKKRLETLKTALDYAAVGEPSRLEHLLGASL